MLQQIKNSYKKLLEYIVIILMITLSVLVIVAVVYRKAGASLSWYDEIASVLLAWITYYASALAAYHRGHIGFNGLLNAMKPPLRIPVLLFGEALVLAFFILLAWVGFEVLRVLEGDSLISLTWIPTRLTQSVIPIGAVLFIIGQVLSFPDIWKQAKTDKGVAGHEDVEIPDEQDGIQTKGERP